MNVHEAGIGPVAATPQCYNPRAWLLGECVILAYSKCHKTAFLEQAVCGT